MRTVTDNTTRSLRNSSIQLLCLFVIVIGSADDAWATCGDYLLNSSGTMQGHFNSVSPRIPKHGIPQGGPVCSGPNCRQNYPVPVAPTKLRSISDQHDAVLIASDQFTESELKSSIEESVVKSASGTPNRIFRPPRFQSSF